MIFVFDIDGVLADNRHRLHHIRNGKRDYDAFYATVGLDTPIHPIVRVATALLNSGAATVELWTGRRESSRAETETWLQRCGVFGYNKLRMRADKDYRKAVVVKKEWLDQCYPCEKPVLVFEDHPDNVKMYRDSGVICCQTFDGELA
jgi:hypothetical protein